MFDLERLRRLEARKVGQRISGSEGFILLMVLIGMAGGLAVVTKGVSVSRTNVASILLRSSTTGIAAVGQFFVVLTAGIDLSVGGVGALCMVLGGLLITGPEAGVPGSFSDVTLPLAAGIGIALLLGTGIGTINGSLVSRVRMPPLIVTLAMWIIARGAATSISHGARVNFMPQALIDFGQGNIAGVPLPFVVFIIVAVLAYLVLYHTTFGKSVYAVGGNPATSWLSGVKVGKITLVVYIISGFLAALAGVLIMARSNVAAAISVGSLELDTVAAVVIGGTSLFGGRGSLIGVVLGVMILGVVSNGMNVMELGPAAQEIVRGVIIFVAVVIDQVRRRNA
jgi:ribose/xylose/arabinose/galactoside ABC-type transport system permease subunit